jgi:hypothetical protein
MALWLKGSIEKASPSAHAVLHLVQRQMRRQRGHEVVFSVTGVEFYKLPTPSGYQSSQPGNARMTPSKATNAIAFAGNARRKQGTKPLQ